MAIAWAADIFDNALNAFFWILLVCASIAEAFVLFFVIIWIVKYGENLQKLEDETI